MKLMDLFKEIDPRMVFGFGVLAVVCFLAVVIALGTVRMETSYGLNVVLGSLSTLAGGFAQWAFSSKMKNNDNEERLQRLETMLSQLLAKQG